MTGAMISGATAQTRTLFVFFIDRGQQFTNSCHQVWHAGAELDLFLILFDSRFVLLSLLIDTSDLVLEGASLGLELSRGVQNIVV